MLAIVAPTNLSATFAGSQVTINWTDNSDTETGYNFKLSTGANSYSGNLLNASTGPANGAATGTKSLTFTYNGTPDALRFVGVPEGWMYNIPYPTNVTQNAVAVSWLKGILGYASTAAWSGTSAWRWPSRR